MISPPWHCTNQNDYRYQADLAERYQGLVGRAT